jgi:hypothetical protein
MMNDRNTIGPKEIGRILESVRALGIHAEAIRIPLAPEGSGSIAISGGKLVVVTPETGDLDAFIASLPARAQALPGFGSLKRAEG